MKINFKELNSDNEKINFKYFKYNLKYQKSFKVCISNEKLDQSILIYQN
jgi:hypothetical protein